MSDNVYFREKHILFIIDKLKDYEFMWNHKCPLYKNKLKRYHVFTNLVEDLNKNFHEDGVFTYSKVIRKWRNLRTYFFRETKKLMENKNILKEEEEEHSSWKYYEKLMFLKQTKEDIFCICNNIDEKSINGLDQETNFSDEISSSEKITLSTQLNESDCIIKHEFLEDIESLSSSHMKSPNSPSLLSKYDIKSTDLNNSFNITTEQSPEPNTNEASSHSDRFYAPKGPATAPKDRPDGIRFDPATTTINETKSHSNQLHPPKKQKKSKNKDDQIMLDSCLNITKQIDNLLKNMTEECAFANYIASELGDLDDDLKLIFKNKVSTLLYEATAQQIERNKEKK